MSTSLERSTSVSADKSDFWGAVWGHGEVGSPPSHPLRGYMESIVRQYGLSQSCILEVGCGAGGMQGLSDRYLGTDFSPACSRYITSGNAFVASSATELPFRSNSFDFVFSIYVLEHIRDIDAALAEIRRVTRPGGLVLLKPAWFCRPWNGRSWFHKPLPDCTKAERLLRWTARIRNSLCWRAAHLVQWRLRGWFSGSRLRHRKLRANYEMPGVIDADAEVWLDPLDIISWFRRRGDECVSHIDLKSRWLHTSDAVIFRIRKRIDERQS